MNRVGRNQPCPCGSGQKFKRCHGGATAIGTAQPIPRYPTISDEALREILKRKEADDFQRARQQGRGRPIISAELNGIRFVAIGSTVAYGPWKTFHDFLLHHAKDKLGRDWGLADLAKPEDQQHPFNCWLRALDGLMKQHTSDPNVVNSMPEYGAVSSVLNFSYDLYLIEHHLQNESDGRAFERLVSRLRHPDQFFGALHETRAAGILLRAGFDLTWEDEDNRRSGKHGEFVAKSPHTGRAFWVECKMRQSTTDKSATFTHLVSDALQKDTTLERLIFVELNLGSGRMDPETGGWPGWAANQLRKLEYQPSAAALPQALIILSNYPEHRNLTGLRDGSGVVLQGFKNNRFQLGETVDLWEALEERERNPEIEDLWRSIEEHSTIPVTFDGSIPGLDESKRLIIGHSYELDDGTVGVLEEATVIGQSRCAAGIFSLADGSRVIVNCDLSEEELQAWRQHPETFFGELKAHSRKVKGAMEMFDFFFSTYSSTPKEKLLEFMGGQDDFEELQSLSQPELAKLYAYRMTGNALERGTLPSAPAWHRRLKRRKNAS